MARRVRAFSLESTVAAKSAGSGYPLGALRPGATIAADCSIATGTINNAMDTLFRIVAASQWEQALASGWVPRCAADERCNRIHLNERRDVERVAALWFSPQERPLALRHRLVPITREIAEASDVKEFVARYTAMLERELDQPVGRTEAPLDGREREVRTGETNLGDFVADVMRERLGADLALPVLPAGGCWS